jgi:hypothetical protein
METSTMERPAGDDAIRNPQSAIHNQAIAHYHALLEEDAGLARTCAEMLAERQQSSRLTYGGRPLCKSLRPQFITRAQYETVGAVCRVLTTAMFRLGRHMLEDPALLGAIDPTAGERRLLAVEPGFQEVSPSTRLDSFMAGDAWQFVEYNAESPAGIAYVDGLSRLFLDLPVMQEFSRAHWVSPLYARHRLVDVLLDAYRQFVDCGFGNAGSELGTNRALPQSAIRNPQTAIQRPHVAIVDWRGLPTATEFELCKEYFEEHGLEVVIADPRELQYDGRRLRAGDFEIDLVYRRVLTSELLERPDAAEALVKAYEDHRVCVVNSFRSKLLHKKMIFALLSDEIYRGYLTDEEWAVCQRHIPWTRKVREGSTTYGGQRVDLVEHILQHKDGLVLKPSDDYGGKGITIGWEVSSAQWETALAGALSHSYVVQERVAVSQQPYPLYDGEGRGGLVFADLSADLDPFIFGTEVTGVLTRLSAAALLNVTAGTGSTVPTFVLEEG